VIFALLIALSLPIALGGSITLNGDFSNVTLYGTEGVLNGKIVIMNTTFEEIKLANFRISAENAQITAEEQRAFITLRDREIEGELYITAHISGEKIDFSGAMDVNGMRIISNNSKVIVENCTFNGRCSKIEFKDATSFMTKMESADMLSGVWMDGEYRSARSALIEDGNINISAVEDSSVDAGQFLNSAAKLWIASVILILFSAHVSRRPKFDSDRRVRRYSRAIALVVVITALYIFDRSFASPFSAMGRTFETNISEIFSFFLVFLLLCLPLHYSFRSLAKIFGFRAAASAIGFIVAFSFLIYLALYTDAIESLTTDLGRDLIGNLPFLLS